MRKFHREFTTNLIQKYCSQKTILDIGIGKGGTLWQYIHAQVNEIYGVEPNLEYIKAAQQRIEEAKGSKDKFPKINFIHAGGEDKEKIKIENKVDTVVSFFSLTFFFKDQNMLENLLYVISSNLKNRGYFVGTCMDGERTRLLLKGVSIDDSLKTKCGQFKKLYTEESVKNSINFGKKINIDMQIIENIVNNQDEYLIDFKLFTVLCQKYNLYLISTNFFIDDQGKNSRSDIPFSRLFKDYVFIKIDPVETYGALEMLEPNILKKIEIHPALQTKLQLATKGEVQLTRHGVIGDGSCLFHSIFTCLSMDETYPYISLSNNDRYKYVKEYREYLTAKLTVDNWENMNNGILKDIYIDKLLNEFYKRWEKVKDNDKKDIIVHKNIITSMLNAKRRDIGFWRWFRKSPDSVETFESNLILGIEYIAYKTYKEKLANPNVWIGGPWNNNSIDAFQYIQRNLEINIYFLDSKTRNIYTETSVSYNMNYKSILLMYLDDLHFEAIKIQRSLGGNSIEDYVLMPYDPIAQMLYQFATLK